MVESAVQSSATVVVDSAETKYRILHVDDDSTLLKIARQCLEIQGPFQVESATSVDEALAKLEKEQYDAVVSDYQMPEKDGLQFLEELRQSGIAIPFIMFTGKGREEVAIKAFNLGADQYVNKHGDPETVYCELAHSIRTASENKREEDAKRRSEERYRTLLESIGDSVYVLDREWRHVIINEAGAKFTRTPKEKLLGNKLTDLFPGVEKTPFFAAFKRVMETRKPETVNSKYVFENGPEGWYEVHVYPVPEGILCISTDITSRKKTEEELRASEEKHRIISGISTDVVFSCLKMGEGSFAISWMAGATEKVFGYSAKEMMDEGCWKFVVQPQDLPTFEEKVTDLKPGQSSVCELRITQKDGSTRWLRVFSHVVEDMGNPENHRLFGACEDITERKKVNFELEESEEKYRRQFEEALDAVFLADAETGILLDCNRAAAKLVGREKSELIGKHQQILHPPEKGEGEFSTTFKQHLKEREGQILETQVITKNGEVKNVAVKTNLFELQDKKMLQGIFRDITKNKKTEESLRESEERSRSLFESIQDPVGIFVGREGRLIDYNTAFKKSSGYTDEELKGKVFLDFVHPDDRDMALGKYRTEYSEDEFPLIYEIRGLNKKGESIPLELGVSTFKKKGKVIGIEVIHRDLTERKKTEMSLRESHQKFEGLFRHNPEAAVYLGLNFKIVDVNPRFCQLFGYSAEEAKGKDINDLVVPEGMREEAESLDKDAKNGYASHDTVRKRKDGSLVPVSISAAPVTFENKLLGHVGIYKDITRLKNAEDHLRELNKMLEVTNEKLHVVGGLTRHDVRNKLSAVTGNAYLLKRKLAEDPEALEQLADMENAVRNAETIFEFARTYEQLGVEQLVNLNVGKAVDEAASLFPDLKGIRIVNECHGLTVLADSLLCALFYNLIDNSLKYGKKLNQIRIHYEKAEENQLRLVYEDDGVGIALDVKPKIFNEGFTTGKGSGYGLHLVKRMMDVYGWTIQETGTQGKGAQFTINMPKAKPDGRPSYKLG